MTRFNLFVALTMLFSTSWLQAEKPAQSVTSPTVTPTRELFVPFEDLNVLLESDKNRVFLSRKEYEELLATAKVRVEGRAPVNAVLLSASYQADFEAGRVNILGELEIEVLNDDAHFIPLTFSHVGIFAAQLDDEPALLARDPQLGPGVIVSKKGRHSLVLQMLSPVATGAAQQTLTVQLPHAPAARFRLRVPGNVEVKSGAAVMERRVDAEANVTHLELALPRDPLNVVLSLNNKLLAKDRVVLARGVFVDEITQAYERLHGTVSLVVLHGALDAAAFKPPVGFEITSVESPLVSKWEVKGGELRIALREPSTETVTLSITALRNGPPPAEWKFPRLISTDAVSQAAVLGVLLEDRLKPGRMTTSQLTPIDVSVFGDAVPDALFQSSPGAPNVRALAAFYAPREAFELSAKFDEPAAELFVTSSVFLTVSDAGRRAEVGLTLLPREEKRFSFDVNLPAGWRLVTARRVDGGTLNVERYAQPDGATRLHLLLPQGAPADVATDLQLELFSAPPGLQTDAAEQTFPFPQFTVAGADRVEGAVALAAEDDLELRPEKIAGLLPLTDAERRRFELGKGEAALAYRYEGTLGDAVFKTVRKPASVTAEVYSFFQVKPGTLGAHHELVYDVRDAAIKELSFSLPADTPQEISIRGLGETAVKETTGTVREGRRLWRVQLAARQRGRVRLAVDLEQRLAEEEPKGALLPQARAENVEYQTGLVSVEGHPELDVQVVKHPRVVDEGELYAAEYQVGPRLVGAFGYLDAAEVRIDVTRHPAESLPSALVASASLVTQISPAGVLQTEATYRLRTKAAFLEIVLPEGSELWTITLNERPTKPQISGEKRLLLSLPGGDAACESTVRIVFEQPGPSNWMAIKLRIPAPQLLVRDHPSAREEEVPTADAKWTLLLPRGFEVRRSFGSVDAVLLPRTPAIARLWNWLADHNIERVVVPSLAGSAPMTKSAATATSDSRSGAYLPPPAAEPESVTIPPPLAEAPNAPPTPDFAKADEVLDKKARDQLPRLTPGEKAPSAKPAEPQSGEMKGEKNEEDPFAAPQTKAKVSGAFDDLHGVAGLLIGIEAEPNLSLLELQGLGDEPEVGVWLVRPFTMWAIGLAAALFVLVGALFLLHRSGATQAKYVVVLLLLAIGLPLLFPSLDTIGELYDGLFFGAILAGVLFACRGLLLPIAIAWRAERSARTARWNRFFGVTSVVLLLMLGGNVGQVNAQAPAVELLDDKTPVKVPADVVIVPYDPEKKEGIESAEKVLVSYEKYMQLWNLAHPDRKLERKDPAYPYAVQTARYETVLATTEFIDVQGTVAWELFGDKPVSIPLAIDGGVLLSAKVNDAAARLQIVEPQPAANNAPAMPARPIPLLHLQGKGKHTLTFTIRMTAERQGGWRRVHGSLPALGGAALTIKSLSEPAEIRLSGTVDREAFDTEKPLEKIETVLAEAGTFTLAWRPRAADAMIDRGLSVRSSNVFDIRRDSLRLAAKMEIEFPRSRRDRLSLEVPEKYTVERVAGENIRAWTEGEGAPAGRRKVEITLLKEAINSETVTVYLANYEGIEEGKTASLTVPHVSVPGAALQQGKLLIRRDARLEVRAGATSGAMRDDLENDPAIVQPADAYDVSPMPLKPFQGFHFSSVPFSVQLSASVAEYTAVANVQSVLSVSERAVSVESRFVMVPRETPIYRWQVVLPKGLRDLDVACSAAGGWEKSVVDEEQERMLTIHFRRGQSTPFDVILSGKLPPRDEKGLISTPRFQLRDVQHQNGVLVVQADPAFDVRVEKTTNCDTIPAEQAFQWLQAGKRSTARAAIRWGGATHAAEIRVVAKRPVVETRLFHNVRITSRAMEETILAEWHVSEAGVREATLLLPVALKSARVNARNARRTFVETTGENLPAGFVRLRVELEDEFLGSYQLLLSYDRLLSAQATAVELPAFESGSSRRRYLTLESAGRDEVVVEKTAGLEPLARGQQAFAEVVAVLGENVTQAYLANSENAAGSMTLSLQQREAVATSSARIGLSETIVTVDNAGAYRARQTYKMDNSSEQYLEVELPTEAKLWTVTVDGGPAKPIVGSSKTAGSIRIPLIRRAHGDADYDVVLQYAGRLGRVGNFGRVAFPFPRSVNIQVERSVVRLRLPESHRWFNFTGTLGDPVEEEGVLKTNSDYYRRQIDLGLEAIKSGDGFSLSRAENNLKRVESSFNQSQAQQRGYFNNSIENNSDLAETNDQLQRALSEVQERQSRVAADDQLGDNRRRLNDLYSEQQLERAKNVVGNDVRNFELRQQNGKGEGQAFKSEWFESNKLALGEDKSGPQGKPSDQQRLSGLKFGIEPKPDSSLMKDVGAIEGKGISGRGIVTRAPGKPTAATPQIDNVQAPKFARGKEGEREVQQKQAEELHKLSDESTKEQAAGRYRMKLQQQQSLNAPVQSANQPMNVQPNAPAPGFDLPQTATPNGPMGGGLGGFGGGGGSGPAGSRPEGWKANSQSGAIDGLQSELAMDFESGLASLDVEIPQRGREYRFTTARGELEIEARYASEEIAVRWMLFAVLLVFAGTLWAAVRYVGRISPRGAKIALGALLILIGLFGLFNGILALWSVIVLAAGVLLCLGPALEKRAAVSPFAATPASEGV